MKDALSLIAGMIGSGADNGELMIPLREDGFGVAKLTRQIVIAEPTVEKVLEAIQKIKASGFKGNVYVPRQMAAPFVIQTEEFVDLGRRLLNEGNGQRKVAARLY
jgi:hypothetical protein